MLVYYTEYDLHRKLAQLLFSEEDPTAKATQCKNAVETKKPAPRKKEARTKQNGEDEKVVSFARLLNELVGLRRLVLVPIISTHTSDKVVMMEAISPAQQRVFNSWASSLYKHSAHGIEAKFPTAEVVLWNIPPPRLT